MVTGVPEGGAAAGLPAFTVRISNRARHVRLVMKIDGDLVIVVPRRFDQRRIPGILEAKRTWVERTRKRIEARQPVPAEVAALPERISLPALDEEWDVEYRWCPEGSGTKGSTPAVARKAPGCRLVVTAPAHDQEACRRALVAWLQRRAKSTLVPRLDELAALHGLSFRQASVRHQRTRWASCSPRKGISLNIRLLFLEPALVDHILIHELCHTVELNHSKRFWALLRAHDPLWNIRRLAAREAWRTLPAWLETRRAAPRL